MADRVQAGPATAAVDLAFESLGDGPPLIVLHGLFGSGTNWRTVARRLSRHRRVLLVDLRNHGRSPHAPDMRYPTLAGDVESLLDRLEIDAVDVVGHSMGGKTAMCLALRSPARVSRLCVVDIAPAASGHDHDGPIGALRALPLEQVTRRADADALLRDAVPEAGLRAFLLQNLEAGPSGYRWRIDLAAIEAALPDLVAWPEPAPGSVYRGPCLFVRGARSDYVTDADVPGIRRLFPAARVHTVDGAGHWVHAESPDAFLAAVEPFLGP